MIAETLKHHRMWIGPQEGASGSIPHVRLTVFALFQMTENYDLHALTTGFSVTISRKFKYRIGAGTDTDIGIRAFRAFQFFLNI